MQKQDHRIFFKNGELSHAEHQDMLTVNYKYEESWRKFEGHYNNQKNQIPVS